MRRGLRGVDDRGNSRAAMVRLLSRVNRPVEQAAVPDDVMVAKKKRSPEIATQRVSLQPAPSGTNVKANQAWKYPGFNIVRADSVLINGRYYTDPKAHKDDYKDAEDMQGKASTVVSGTPRRKQESNFLITINPNQVYGDTTHSHTGGRISSGNDRTLIPELIQCFGCDKSAELAAVLANH